MAEEVLESEISLGTHEAFQNLSTFMGAIDQASAKLNTLGSVIEKIEGRATKLGTSWDKAGKEIVETGKAADATTMTALHAAATMSADDAEKLQRAWDEAKMTFALVSEASEEAARKAKMHSEMLDEVADHTERRFNQMGRTVPRDMDGVTSSVDRANKGTTALGNAAKQMIGAWVGVQGVQKVVEAIERSLDGAAAAARKLAQEAVVAQAGAQNVAINLGIPLADAQKMISALQKTAAVSEQQSITTIAAVQAVGLDPTKGGGKSITESLAQFAGRMQLDPMSIQQLAKVVGDQKIGDKEGIELFLARLEELQRRTPDTSPASFFSGMFKGVVEQQGATGAGFWGLAGQYSALMGQTRSSEQASEAMQQMSQVTQGASPEAIRWLARQARRMGLTTPQLPGGAEMEAAVAAREMPEAQTVQQIRDQQIELKQRREGAEEGAGITELRAAVKDTSRAGRRRTAAQREADAAALTKAENDFRRQNDTFDRQQARLDSELKEAQDKLTDVLAGKVETDAWMSATQETRMKLFQAFAKTDEGKKQLRTALGSEQALMRAIAFMKPEVTEQAAATTAAALAASPAELRERQAQHMRTALAQDAINAGLMAERALAAKTPENIAFENLMKRAEQRLTMSKATGAFTLAGGGTPISMMKSEAHHAAQAAEVEVLDTMEQEAAALTPEQRSRYAPEIKHRIAEARAAAEDSGTAVLASVRVDRTRRRIFGWQEMKRNMESVADAGAFEVNKDIRARVRRGEPWEMVYIALKANLGKEAENPRWRVEYERQAKEVAAEAQSEAAGAKEYSRGARRAAGMLEEDDAGGAGLPDIPATPLERAGSGLKIDPELRSGADGDLGLPDVPGASAATARGGGRRASGKPRSTVINNVTIGTVVSKGGDALDLPGRLEE